MQEVWQRADKLDVFESGWTFDHLYPLFDTRHLTEFAECCTVLIDRDRADRRGDQPMIGRTTSVDRTVDPESMT